MFNARILPSIHFIKTNTQKTEIHHRGGVQARVITFFYNFCNFISFCNSYLISVYFNFIQLPK